VTDNDIDISIVYLTKNGGKLFKDSLSSVFEQRINRSFEVICIDSGSVDSTIEVIKSYPTRLYQIKPEKFSFGAIRDFGFSKARGNIIVTLSQDVVPCNEKWLYYLIQPFEFQDVAAVQGHDVRPLWDDVFFWEKVGYFYFTRETRRWLRDFEVGLSCSNMAIKRDVWCKCKFGDTPMSEDKALQVRLKEKGYKIIFAKEAQAFHGHHYNVWSLIKRCENEGLGWRYAGVRYSLFDMLYDIISIRKFLILLRMGVFGGRMLSLSEILFPFIRPIWLYKGNHFTKSYRY